MADPARSPRVSPRRRRRLGPAVEGLEPRELMTVSATPTDFEQAMLELINRARANPPAEAQRLLALSKSDPLIMAATAHWDMNAVVAKISSYAPEPPLAFNPRLIEAARAEDVAMLTLNSQRHAPAGFLTNPSIAVASDGQVYFDITGATWATGENIYGFSSNVNSPSTLDYVNYFYAGFMIDWGNPDFGHLTNILAPGPAESGSGTHLPYSEIGIGLLTNVTPTAPPDPNPPDPGNLGLSVGPDLVTQEFGWRSTASADLTGTFFVDRAHTGFYAPGEGLGGVTITAVARGSGAVYQAQTWSSGGYTLTLPPGTYDLTASGGGLAGVTTAAVSPSMPRTPAPGRSATRRPGPSPAPASAGRASTSPSPASMTAGRRPRSPSTGPAPRSGSSTPRAGSG
jgi:serralysin